MRKDDGAVQAARLILENGVELGEVFKACQRLDAERKEAKEAKEAKEPQWLVSKEVMTLMRISRTTMWRLIQKGELKAVKLSKARSGRLLISSASLAELLEARRIVIEGE